MSKIKINDLNINYELKGKKGKNVILLHGWGQNIKMMDYIAEYLSKHFKVYNIDFPRFGESDEPKVPFSNEEYVEVLKGFTDKLKIKNPILIGHSFGCRVALYYAYKYPVHKMVLTGAAGIRAKRDIKWYIKVYSYKLAKKLLKPFKSLSAKLMKNAGSQDYRNASPVMKGTLSKCVNFDITPYLKDIKTQTLLVYGTLDTATPLYMGKIMEKEMRDATLVTFEGDDHFAYFHQADRFNLVLDAFLKEDYE